MEKKMKENIENFLWKKRQRGIRWEMRKKGESRKGERKDKKGASEQVSRKGDNELGRFNWEYSMVCHCTLWSMQYFIIN